MVGAFLTSIGAVGNEGQPVAVNVKVKVAVPGATPVTTPPFVTVATAGLLLVHVPPVLGDNVVLFPIQISALPTISTVGLPLTVSALDG
jgi:hypothetical protein